MDDQARASRWTLGKSAVVSSAGMVTAGHRLAAEAGVAMLRAGGNAVDAAVAASWAVGVVEPWMSGPGGVGALVVHGGGRDVAIDFGLRAPLAARPDMYTLLPERGPQGQYGWPAVRDDDNQLGHRSAGVPGVVAGLCAAHARFGALSREAVMEPAIALAQGGFEADWYTSLILGLDLDVLARFPAAAAIFLRDGVAPPRPSVLLSVPDRIVQRDLAGTLRAIASRGPDAFYRGEIARALAEDMRKHAGLLTEDDLASYRPRVHEEGLRGTYRGLDVVGVPGPTGAPVVQGILNILDGYDIPRLGTGVTGLHLVAEACRRAYEDFFAHVGDPDQVRVPWAGLLSPRYAAAVRDTIRLDRASGERARVEPRAFLDGEAGPATSHTTHVCAVDRERQGASITLTLGNLLGSHVVVPGTGVVLNDMMLLFDPRPGRANSIGAGKWQASPVAPTLLADGGRLRAVLGTPGGRRIPTAIAQIIVNLVDHGLGMQEAIAAPRLHAEGPDVLVDDRLGPAVVEGLRALGHRVETAERTPCSFNFAQPNGIAVGPDGALAGGADPFTPAVAVGL
jgi:gamma-glutamyltranspeptidase/glutathione hydrolase